MLAYAGLGMVGAVLQLHHLALGARDVERVARFYAQVFELPELRRHHYENGVLRSIWLKLADTVLMVEHTERMRDRFAGVDAGLFLLAFSVSPKNHDELEERLAALGHPLESKTENTRYFRDPEGNRFAVSSYDLTAD
jgi:glyoxylase I family protein